MMPKPPLVMQACLLLTVQFRLYKHQTKQALIASLQKEVI